SINWDLIRQQYDQMIKYATALRLGTADTEAILKRFTRNNLKHPTYQALAELGKVIKTIFLCEYLNSEQIRREIHEGLNVVENWNSANSFIFYGKGGEISTNRLEDQEIGVLSLHLLQNCLVYINTLMIQEVLSEQKWFDMMETEDLRALTPLVYSQVNPYGTFELNMDERLHIKGDINRTETRTPAKKKAKQLAKYLRGERPDYDYLKRVFQYLREDLEVEVTKKPKKLPYVPTEEELKQYYNLVWNGKNFRHIIIIKTFLYTGVRVSELINIELTDVDLSSCQIRINKGKGDKDRIVPFPQSFRELLA